MRTLVHILKGGPFGNIKCPKHAVVVSDAQLLQLVLDHGCLPRDFHEMKLLIIELGRLQHKNEIAPGIIGEIVTSRAWLGDLPTVLLVHDAPRYAWRASRSADLESALESLGATIEPFRGKGHIKLAQLDEYVPRLVVDDASEPDYEVEQPNYNDASYDDELAAE